MQHLPSLREGKEIPASSLVRGRHAACPDVANKPQNPNKARACATSNKRRGCREGYAENLTPGAQSQKGSGGSGVTAIPVRQLPSCLFSCHLIKSLGSCRHIIIYLFLPAEALFFRKVYASERDVAWALEKRGCLRENNLCLCFLSESLGHIIFSGLILVIISQLQNWKWCC